MEIVQQMEAAAGNAIRALAKEPHNPDGPLRAIERMSELQELYGREFTHALSEDDFWETLWLRTDRVRQQWDRIEKASTTAGVAIGSPLQAALNERRGALYHWTRQHICEHAPRVPTAAHFERGLGVARPDCRGLHQRIEGLCESIVHMGRLPEIRDAVSLPLDGVNFAIIYGGGWNVSTFSVLREAWRFQDINAFVAFDHAGSDLYGRVGPYRVRLATAGLLRTDDEDDYVLATFDEPAVLHFVCPHQWTGRPPHELGLPVLRSDLTLEIVDDKLNTTRALEWYVQETGAELPLIREEGIRQARVPTDLKELSGEVHEALRRLEAQGISEVVIKPVRGEQKQGLGYFELPDGRDTATAHAVRLALESGAVIQERIRPQGTVDLNWRVLAALGPDREPHVVGRFARVGHEDVTEKARDRDILGQCGVTGREADSLLTQLDRVAMDAFRAVSAYAEAKHPDFPWRPLGGGSYHVPYFLGIDLIGNAYVMEINGNEVGGMWVDDQLYPEALGRSNRTVLESARIAAAAYRAVIEEAR